MNCRLLIKVAFVAAITVLLGAAAASAASFDRQSVLLIQTALQYLGYDTGKPDGVWGRRTSAAVRHYRYDFGMAESRSLSLPEARQLVTRSEWLNHEPGLVSVETGNPSKSVEENWAFGSHYPAERFGPLLYGSRRHAMVMEMLGAYATFAYGDQALSSYERERAVRWLEDDIRRMRKGGYEWSATLVEIDMALKGLRGNHETSYILSEAVPKIAYLFVDTANSNTPENTFRFMSLRLFDSMGAILQRAECTNGALLEDDVISLAEDVLERYLEGKGREQVVVLGYELNLAKCSPPDIARRYLSQRVDRANALARQRLSRKAMADWAVFEDKLGNKKESLGLFKRAFAKITDNEGKDLYKEYSWTLSEMGSREFIERYVLSYASEVMQSARSSQVAMSSTRFLAAQMMKLDFGFEQIDPLFTSIRDGDWLGTKDPLDYYPIVVATFLDIGDFEHAEDWSRRLVKRSIRESNIAASIGFRGQLIDALLRLGKLERAEEQIALFSSEIAGRGQNLEAALASWQSRLRLVQREALPIGISYVDGLLAALPKLCRDVPDGAGWTLIPSLDREALYRDPSFLRTAKNSGLARKLAECRGNEWVLEALDRTRCYVWASLGEDAYLEDRMRGWIGRLKSDGYIGEDSLACPMGVAEAGRLELLERHKSSLATRTDSGPAGLLLLALDQSGALTERIRDQWVRPEDNINFTDYIGVEIAGRFNAPDRSMRRQNGLTSFEIYNSGASMDTAEEARIRSQALDLGMGFEALKLNEVALMFYEAGLHDVPEAIHENEAISYIYDEEKTRFVLARARLALHSGDIPASLDFSTPMVSAVVTEIENGNLGSFDGLGQWSGRLAGIFEVYLSALAADPTKLSVTRQDTVVLAQQFLHLAQSATSTGRLQSRLTSSNPVLVREYQDALRKMRQTLARPGGSRGLLSVQREMVNELRRKLEAEEPGFARTFNSSLLDLKTISRTAGGAAKVIITSLPSHVLTTVIQGEKTVIRAANSSRQESRRLVMQFRDAVIQDDYDAIGSLGTELSELLFGDQFADQVPDRIGIVVEDAFAALPFGALPLKHQSDGKREYLGAASAIAIAPSTSALTIERSKVVAGTERKPFLGFGDVEFSSQAAERLLGFQPNVLRETNSELRFLSAVFGADPGDALFTKESATESALSRLSEEGLLSRYEVIAFATHGFLGVPGKLTEPALLLSNAGAVDVREDGLLKASEISDLRLDARLVLLSACDTGGIAEGQSGLSDITQAFTYAGARSLMVTHWEIDSGAAVEISKRLALQMRSSGDMLIADALREAITELLSDANAKQYQAPRYWASHVVVGFN
jgi:CHAT domain-containing protein